MIGRIRELLAARPFTPFRVTLKAGVTDDITDPDLVELSSDLLRLSRHDPTNPATREWRSILALQHVTSVETLEHEYPFFVQATN